MKIAPHDRPPETTPFDAVSGRYNCAAMHKPMLVLLSAFLLCATAESHARVSSLPTPRWVADDEKDVGDVTNRGERRGGKLIVVFTPVGLRRDSPPRARTLARSGP